MPPAHGQVLTQRTNDVVIVALRGEHGVATSEAIREDLVDLWETTFMHSSVIGALLHASRHATRSHRLLIALPPVKTAVRTLFELLSADEHFEMYRDREAAFRSAVQGRSVPASSARCG